MAAGTPILPGRYEEPRLIGRGGMGEIYLARDRLLGRTVAVKLLAERLAEEPELRERFRREALTAARLSEEPHVVTVYDVGEHAGRPFTVMEYLPGGTLAERAQSRPVEPEQALAWLAAGRGRARRRARKGRRPPRRQAREPPLRRRRSAAGRRLRDREGDRRHPGYDGAGDDPRHGRLPRARAGSRPGDDGGERPLRARRRRLRAPYRRAAVRPRLGDRRGGRADPRPGAARLRTGPLAPAAVDPVFARALAKNPVHRYPSSAAFVDGAARGAARHSPAAGPAPAPPAQEPAGRPRARRRRPLRRGRARRGAPCDARRRSLDRLRRRSARR